jgi:hypothetical protein
MTTTGGEMVHPEFDAKENAMNDEDMTPSPSIGEVTMDAYLTDMQEILAQAEADGLVDITPSDAPR